MESLTAFLATRLVGEQEAVKLSAEVMDYIDRHIGRDYHWPGNVRELEQCVRNVMIRGACVAGTGGRVGCEINWES